MILTHTPGALKRFGRAAWRFQRTFETPLHDLDRFVSTIASAHGHIQEARITIEQVVFDAKHLSALIFADASPVQLTRGFSITTGSPQEIEPLLRAAFSDWIDFLFVPALKPFVIYADHDEFVTFYANTKSHLNQIVKPLTSQGYSVVQNWKREL
jgi:hypothetical protein